MNICSIYILLVDNIRYIHTINGPLCLYMCHNDEHLKNLYQYFSILLRLFFLFAYSSRTTSKN